MNPYEATLPNVIARLLAWVQGLLRLYRRPLLIAASAGIVVALALSATPGPAASPIAAASAPTR